MPAGPGRRGQRRHVDRPRGGGGWAGADIGNLVSPTAAGLPGSGLGVDTTGGSLSLGSPLVAQWAREARGQHLAGYRREFLQRRHHGRHGMLTLASTGALPGYAKPGLVSVASGGTLTVSAGGSGWAGATSAFGQPTGAGLPPGRGWESIPLAVASRWAVPSAARWAREARGQQLAGQRRNSYTGAPRSSAAC